MSNIVGSKGQVVIEKEIREHLGVRKGSVAVQRLMGDHVEIHFLPPPHRRSLKGSLAQYAKDSRVPPTDWDEVRERAWETAASDKAKGGDG
jgi:bifunctional DNA-binding transcriptional regulator/antitoxin component of YhaV-PrlF toxin-antitoxin module